MNRFRPMMDDFNVGGDSKLWEAVRCVAQIVFGYALSDAKA